jgi:hypothetical protein
MHTERAVGSRENGQEAPCNNTSLGGVRMEGRHVSPPWESAFWHETWSSFFAHPDAVTSLASSST